MRKFFDTICTSTSVVMYNFGCCLTGVVNKKIISISSFVEESMEGASSDENLNGSNPTQWTHYTR